MKPRRASRDGFHRRGSHTQAAAAAFDAFAKAEAQLGFRALAKRYYGADFHELRTSLFPEGAAKGVFEDGARATECDGVVLAKALDDHGYYDAVCFKYKPRVTLDVRLRFRGDFRAPGDADAAVADLDRHAQ